ncbi:MAG: hypothetical protein C7B46_07985 [Sulfobacillus benefaciens]|uniref:Uncharacterized protein n=1 Tax=Sulfobacillus benefaciens TaxID=453960 RepID=A0A2T2XH21_9FIRM|nr:MAG: hypothetical protein C7B46_07985 [Sulfobacillus benefaciens]
MVPLLAIRSGSVSMALRDGARGNRNILHPGRHEYLAGLFIQLMYTGKTSHPDNTLHHRQPVALPVFRESP